MSATLNAGPSSSPGALNDFPEIRAVGVQNGTSCFGPMLAHLLLLLSRS